MPHDAEDPILKRIQALPVEFFVFVHIAFFVQGTGVLQSVRASGAVSGGFSLPCPTRRARVASPIPSKELTSSTQIQLAHFITEMGTRYGVVKGSFGLRKCGILWLIYQPGKCL